MKTNTIFIFWLFTRSTSAFSFQAATGSLVSVDEYTERDVYSMVDWASNCGVEKADGFDLTSFDGRDYEVMTHQDIAAGSPLLFVPNEMIFSSTKAEKEFGGELIESENLVPLKHKPLFRIFVKILIEYEKGESSPWYPWLNATPRLYNTGSAMTYACFDCLPPFAAELALKERQNFVNFQRAVMLASNLISQDTLKNVKTLKWAYNVATTRSIEMNGERILAPVVDMFNHGTETDVDISYDEEGNCMAYVSRDVPAGYPLRTSLGDPTNPSYLFARYGFLDESSPATFCKMVHLEKEMEELGYEKSNLLFYKETGEISIEVYDVQLYSILKKNDPGMAQQFYQAVRNGDDETKNQFHQHYFEYTKESLQKHVDSFLGDLEKLCNKAKSYDPLKHPRVPVIVQHNEFVQKTFLKVKQNLDNM